MNKKLKIIALACVVGAAAVTIASVFPKGDFSNTFAGFTRTGNNGYGCKNSCTAEYSIEHVYRIFEEKPKGYRATGVRFKVSYTYDIQGYRWFKDTSNTEVINSTASIKANLGSVLAVGGIEQGFTNIRKGETIAFFGEIRKGWDPWHKSEILYVENPTYYRVGEKEDLSLLQTPVYID